jgi:chaperone modulatory protein CbpM
MTSDASEIIDTELDEPLTPEMIAETAGVRVSLVVLLARNGILETVENRTEEPLLPRRAVLQLRKMQRLRRDLGVNFAGAGVILEMVEQMEVMRRKLAELRARYEM